MQLCYRINTDNAFLRYHNLPDIYYIYLCIAKKLHERELIVYKCKFFTHIARDFRETGGHQLSR